MSKDNDIVMIICPYCGEKVIMDWKCDKCKKTIAYDISIKGVRSNPHKAGESSGRN